jgi:hypothetical protein
MEFRLERGDARIVPALERHVTTRNAARRHDWLYHKNPAGRAFTWVCEDDGQIVGWTTIFPRIFVVDGKVLAGSIGCDAYVLPSHRRRGIAVQLHRASRTSMTRGEVPFRFMCGPPVVENLRALVKAGARIVCTLRYESLPLSPRGLLWMLHMHGERAVRAAEASRLLGAALGGTRYFASRGGRGLEVRRVHEAGPAFDRLWERLAPQLRICGMRDAKWLEWRYLDNPVCPQVLVAIELGGELLGWAALELAEQGCLLVDHLLPLDPELGSRALGALIAYVAGQRACRIVVRQNLDGPYAQLFRRHGFVAGFSREEVQILSGSALGMRAFDAPAAWQIQSGDLNPESTPWSVSTAPAEPPMPSQRPRFQIFFRRPIRAA